MQIKRQVYLVTGAAGFIGSHLCHALLNEPNTRSVIGIDTINDYYNPVIKNRRIKTLLQAKRFSFYKTSVLDETSLISVAKKHKPDILIHAAAAVGVRNGESNPLEYFSTNVTGTITALEATKPYIHHAVVFSSSSVYGSTRHLPFREGEPITILTPISVYGASKVAMEIASHYFYKRTGIPITIVRPFSIYGPDGRPDMLPIKLLVAARTKKPITIYAPATTSRDWTYIDDCIGMIMALVKRPSGIQTVNVGNGHPIQLNTLITISQRIISTYGYSIKCINKPANPIEVKKTWADTTKIQAIYYKQLTPFERGFSETADFFFKHADVYS